MPDALRIGDPAIEVRLRRNRRARRMILTVPQAGSAPVLTLPLNAPLAGASAFLSDHEGWLRRQIAVCRGSRPVRNGTVLPLGGGTLEIASADGRLRRTGDVLHVPGPPGRLPGQVAAWLREAARQHCVAAAERHAAAVGRRVGRITLRDTRSRWGSCSSSGDLMFSWRLVLAPEQVLDYVAAHEVAHLVEMNHSHRFWRVVGQLCPEFETGRQWLRKHGPALHAYDFSAPRPD